MNLAVELSNPETVGALLPQSERAPFGIDSEFLAKLRAGDEEACEALVRECSGRLLAVARRLLRNEDDARDAVQDAFLAAFRSIEHFNGAARLSTWLHRIVVNAALMKIRSAGRHPEEAIQDLLPRFDEEGAWVDAPSQFHASADALLERQETRAAVRRCIDALPESYRTVLLLRDIEDLDTEEVAISLGITANAVKIRLHRARQALRTLLQHQLDP